MPYPSQRDSIRRARIIFFVFVAGLASTCWGQTSSTFRTSEHYDKHEHRVIMRDGVRLYTVVYTPKDTSTSYPILLQRTPYSCRPYGADQVASRIGPSRLLEEEGFIFVRQDVRGRWMSEGTYDNMRPHIPGDRAIDESSDTYDTIQWLLENVEGHNGKVGMYGISYPGFYAAAALPEHHPALVAVSPQAPIADFFFDDFHHQGAYMLSYFLATPTFGYQHAGPVDEPWYKAIPVFGGDGYEFFMKLGSLRNAGRYYKEDNFFWRELTEHPNYDDFWQARSILPHLHDVHTNVMTVGGWFDAEDLYGPLNIYRTLETENPGMFNVLVMGPWSHGDWSRNAQIQQVGNIVFGERISEFYQREVEAPFFRHFLKGEGEPPAFEALVFDTGRKSWRTFRHWPPATAQTAELYFAADRHLQTSAPDAHGTAYSEFVSDPGNPVPYRRREDIALRFTPRPYMTDDQRFAAERDDVLVFQTDELASDITLAGSIVARLHASTSETAADWIVKLIDVYPDDEPNQPNTPNGIELAGYQQMVRSEAMRGRFREGFERPQPFERDKPTEVRIPLQDVFHTFKGHRIMVQVQSTWFPLIDRNPQKFVDNIYKAADDDFIPATHRVYHSAELPSRLEVHILGE